MEKLWWYEARLIMEGFSAHYSVTPEQAWEIWKYALTLGEGDQTVELGVCNGRTAAMLCYACGITGAKYTGIDHFGLENSADSVRKLLADHALTGEILEGNTHEIGRGWTEPISLLFVDAGHDEENVRPDCGIWVPKVKAGGIAIFHDYDEPFRRESAHWAVRHYADLATAGWERLAWEGGMLIARRQG